MRLNVPILERCDARFCSRFLKRVRKKGPNECWIFKGCQNKAGYGIVDSSWRTSRVAILAHRLAWVIANGAEIPEDKIICHTCDNPSCCNPAHLQLGTPQSNNADKIARGRHAHGPTHPRPLLGRKGTKHPRALYTDAQKAEAIAMRMRGKPFHEIAAAIECGRDTPTRWWKEHCAAIVAKIRKH